MSAFEIWLFFVVLPGIEGFATFLVFVSFLTLFTGCWLVVMLDFDEDTIKGFVRWLKYSAVPTVVFFLLAISAPDERQAALIVGGSYATQIEAAESLPPNLVKAMNKALESYIED